MIESLFIAVYAFRNRLLTSLSVDEILVLRYVNSFADFSGLSHRGNISSVKNEYLLLLYNKTNVLCCKERSPQKKKYSNSKIREENISIVETEVD